MAAIGAACSAITRTPSRLDRRHWADAQALREQIAQVLATLGLRSIAGGVVRACWVAAALSAALASLLRRPCTVVVWTAMVSNPSPLGKYLAGEPKTPAT